jgi:hypothetical protein
MIKETGLKIWELVRLIMDLDESQVVDVTVVWVYLTVCYKLGWKGRSSMWLDTS